MTANIPVSTKTTSYTLPRTTRLGLVHLTVANLERQIAFYTQVLGMTLHWREGAEAALGTADEILLRLTAIPGAPRIERATGMYHFAPLYPNRRELARATAHLFALRYPNAPTDHGVSKSIYLDDPEGNTIELYILTIDDARLGWENGHGVAYYADGRIGTGRDPLDLDALFQELKPDDPLDLPMPTGTRIGHVNLYVNSNEATIAFYTKVLGFQQGPYFPEGRFGDVELKDGQVHVVAYNTWKGTNLPPTPESARGLRYFTIVLPDSAELQRLVTHVRGTGIASEDTPEGVLVHDPSKMNVVLTDRMLAPR